MLLRQDSFFDQGNVQGRGLGGRWWGIRGVEKGFGQALFGLGFLEFWVGLGFNSPCGIQGKLHGDGLERLGKFRGGLGGQIGVDLDRLGGSRGICGQIGGLGFKAFLGLGCFKSGGRGGRNGCGVFYRCVLGEGLVGFGLLEFGLGFGLDVAGCIELDCRGWVFSQFWELWGILRGKFKVVRQDWSRQWREFRLGDRGRFEDRLRGGGQGRGFRGILGDGC